jgi:hypothetical protein
MSRSILAPASLVLPVAGMTANVLLQRTPADSPSAQGEAIGQACVVFGLYVAGLICAIVALRSREPGEKKLPAAMKWTALAGLILDSILVLAMIVGFVYVLIESRNAS